MSFGIDLGTQSCRAAVWQNGVPVIIPDEAGTRAQPSYIAFSPEGRTFGAIAKARQGANIANTVFGVKRFLGRDLVRDHKIKAMATSMPFRISCSDSTASVKVDHCGHLETLSLEEIIAMQLSRISRIVKAHTGLESAHLVIAVPPGFSRHQRQAIVDACDIAGLIPPHLIDDTSAAALYYAFYSPVNSGTSHSPPTEKKILILSIGAGITSVSVTIVEEGIVEVKAACSDLHLGGNDFDEAIADLISSRLQTKQMADSPANLRTRATLLSLAERARKELSSAMSASVDLDALHPNGPPTLVSITRDEIDVLCSHLYREVLRLVKKGIQRSGLPKSEVSEVLLVGGATRMPGIFSTIKSYFPNETPIYSIRNLDEAVALGAAIYGMLKGQPAGGAMPKKLESILLMDVTHEPLGVAVLQGHNGSPVKVLVPKNTTIPCAKSFDFTVTQDGGRTASIQVYEGDNKQPMSNAFLGSFELHDIPAGSPGGDVRIIFDLNADRSLVVSAIDSNNRKRSMQVRVGRISKGNKEAMKEKARRFDAFDRLQESRIRKRNDLEEYCYNARESMKPFEGAVEVCLDWLQTSTISQQSDRELEQRQDAIVEHIKKLLPPGFFIGREASDSAPHSE